MSYKRTIEGYFVRDYSDKLFSTEPFKDKGFFDDAEYWNPCWHTDGEIVNIRDLDSVLELSKDIDDNTPRRCKITIELSDPIEYESTRNDSLHIEYLAEKLATASGKSKEEIMKALR